MAVLWKIATYLLGALVICAAVYAKYLQAKWQEDRRDRKSEIQHLLSRDD